MLTITGCSCHKYHFCHDKHKTMLVATKPLSRQNTFFIVSKLCRYHFCRDKHVFCRDKYVFCSVATNTSFVLSRQTRLLLRQTRFCRDKTRYCDKGFLVATKRLSRQNIFVTKMKFVAAGASDSSHRVSAIRGFLSQSPVPVGSIQDDDDVHFYSA